MSFPRRTGKYLKTLFAFTMSEIQDVAFSHYWLQKALASAGQIFKGIKVSDLCPCQQEASASNLGQSGSF